MSKDLQSICSENDSLIKAEQDLAETPSPKKIREQLRKKLTRGKSGAVVNSRINVSLVLSEDPILTGAFQYNDMTQQCDVVRPVPWYRPPGDTSFNDNDLRGLCFYMEENYQLTLEKQIHETLLRIANESHYHPILDILESLRWDGTPRVDHMLHHFLGAPDDEYTGEVMKLFMLGAVCRLDHPGIKYDYMLCLSGGQGIGKSSFLRLLSIRDDWFTDDIRDLESENTYSKLRGHWIIELSEMLASNNAKSIEAVKAFLSRQKDTYRTPYDKYSQDRPRQCIIAGTTNKASFLPLDRSGNRRFLPVQCSGTEAEVHILDDVDVSREYIMQCWAEIMEIYRSGDYELTLSPAVAETLEEIQENYLPEDTEAGTILAFMEETTHTFVCSKLLYKEALGNLGEPKRYETNNICEIMNSLIGSGRLPGWKAYRNPKRIQGYGKQKGWEHITHDVVPSQFHEIKETMENPFEENSGR